MANCTNDLTPIIIAIAAAIPTLVGILATYAKVTAQNRQTHKNQYEQIAKTDKLTYITENGFHGPPGPAGPVGPVGPVSPAINET